MFDTATNSETSTTNEVVMGGPEVETNTDEPNLGEGTEETTELTQEELDEIEVEGQKFQLPKTAAEKLKAERMMHADYTRKTQEAAERRRQMDAEAESFQKQREVHQQYIADVAEIASIDKQLAQYNGLDWTALINQDPVEALKHQNNVRMLQESRTKAVQTLAQKQQQNALNEQQSFAKQAQEAEAYFAREIPGWSPARSDQLMKYGVAEGVQPQAITKFVLANPALAKILHKAELYDQIQKKQPPAKSPTPQAKPVPKVGQTASVKKDTLQMTDAEYARWRKTGRK